MKKHDNNLHYLTSEEAELLPLPDQLARLMAINKDLVDTHNQMVIRMARLEDELKALKEEFLTYDDTKTIWNGFGSSSNSKNYVTLEQAVALMGELRRKLEVYEAPAKTIEAEKKKFQDDIGKYHFTGKVIDSECFYGYHAPRCQCAPACTCTCHLERTTE